MLDPSTLAAVANCLSTNDFFLAINRRVFSSMVSLRDQGRPLSLVTLLENLQEQGGTSDNEELAYVTTLGDDLPRVATIGEHCRIVKKKAALRHTIHLANVIQERAFAGEFEVGAAEQLKNIYEEQPNEWRGMFHTWEEFENTAPLTFAIRDFLQNSGATMIGGLSGHGKTLILLSITRALLQGKGHRLFNLFEVEEEAARVVYLIPECSIEPLKHRLNLFGIYAYLAPDNERLLVRTLSKGQTPSLSDPRTLQAAKGAHVVLDTAIRFSTGEENEAGDNRQLANDIFALLGSGARSVIGAHHSPKAFEKESTMRLENVLRGSSDIGAMLTTCWAIRQIEEESNVIHIENVKARDFQPCGPFQIIGRPFISEEGDFRMYKTPGECGSLADEREPDRDKGGAPAEARAAKVANKELLRRLLCDKPASTSSELSQEFSNLGIKITDSTIRKYRKELGL